MSIGLSVGALAKSSSAPLGLLTSGVKACLIESRDSCQQVRATSLNGSWCPQGGEYLVCLFEGLVRTGIIHVTRMLCAYGLRSGMICVGVPVREDAAGGWWSF